jgi:hypothetical protein
VLELEDLEDRAFDVDVASVPELVGADHAYEGSPARDVRDRRGPTRRGHAALVEDL